MLPISAIASPQSSLLPDGDLSILTASLHSTVTPFLYTNKRLLLKSPCFVQIVIPDVRNVTTFIQTQQMHCSIVPPLAY
jgi:hypothetical protein